jgi:hypothetical protein
MIPADLERSSDREPAAKRLGFVDRGPSVDTSPYDLPLSDAGSGLARFGLNVGIGKCKLRQLMLASVISRRSEFRPRRQLRNPRDGGSLVGQLGPW